MRKYILNNVEDFISFIILLEILGIWILIFNINERIISFGGKFFIGIGATFIVELFNYCILAIMDIRQNIACIKDIKEYLITGHVMADDQQDYSVVLQPGNADKKREIDDNEIWNFVDFVKLFKNCNDEDAKLLCEKGGVLFVGKAVSLKENGIIETLNRFKVSFSITPDFPYK